MSYYCTRINYCFGCYLSFVVFQDIYEGNGNVKCELLHALGNVVMSS